LHIKGELGWENLIHREGCLNPQPSLGVFPTDTNGLAKPNTSYIFLTLPWHAISSLSVQFPVQVPFNIVNTFQENQPAQSPLPHTGKSARQNSEQRTAPALDPHRSEGKRPGEVDPSKRAWQEEAAPRVSTPAEPCAPLNAAALLKELPDPPSLRVAMWTPPLSSGPPSAGL
jgi:hypothetical protein